MKLKLSFLISLGLWLVVSVVYAQEQKTVNTPEKDDYKCEATVTLNNVTPVDDPKGGITYSGIVEFNIEDGLLQRGNSIVGLSANGTRWVKLNLQNSQILQRLCKGAEETVGGTFALEPLCAEGQRCDTYSIVGKLPYNFGHFSFSLETNLEIGGTGKNYRICSVRTVVPKDAHQTFAEQRRALATKFDRAKIDHGLKGPHRLPVCERCSDEKPLFRRRPIRFWLDLRDRANHFKHHTPLSERLESDFFDNRKELDTCYVGNITSFRR